VVAVLLAPAAAERARVEILSKAELRDEKRRLLRALKELEFDHGMGKLSKADFESVSATYKARAIEVMRALDGTSELHPDLAALLRERNAKSASGASASAASSSAASSSAASSSDATRASDASASDGTGASDANASAASARTCSACGATNDDDARFCKRCGTGLAA
jgi:ribosomal protein L40E